MECWTSSIAFGYSAGDRGGPITKKKLLRHASDGEPFSALAFKIMTDPFAGQLTYFRVLFRHAQNGNNGAVTLRRIPKSGSVGC